MIITFSASTSTQPATLGIHVEVLKKNRVRLHENLEVENSLLLQYLMQDDVLSYKEVDRIRTTAEEHRQATMLIDMLSRKTYNDYKIFLQALVKSDQQHIAKMLTDAEVQIRKEPLKTQQSNYLIIIN